VVFGSRKCMVLRKRSRVVNMSVFSTLTNPATETKSMGAAADAPAPMVFATQLRKLYHDKTLSAHLDGKAKTIYAATQSATNHTAGRYWQ
jgi:hypothetical protein